MTEKATVVIIEDHPLFRKGLIGFLETQSDYQVIGQAHNGITGISAVRKLKPDLVIMDISLPDISGIDATREIMSSLPAPKVVILSMHSNIKYITEAFKAGARGYVTKESAEDKILECLKTANRGEYYLDTLLSQQVVKDLLRSDEDKRKVTGPGHDRLTAREQEIIVSIAKGFSIKEIADKLFISEKTVENHRANIYFKLNVHSTLELAKVAAKYGLIDVDLWKQ